MVNMTSIILLVALYNFPSSFKALPEKTQDCGKSERGEGGGEEMQLMERDSF